MPKVAKELSAVEIRRLTSPGFHSVGGVAGLALYIRSQHARSWVLRVKVGNKRRNFGLGGYPTVTLQEARARARKKRAQIELGYDPAILNKSRKAAVIEKQSRQLTFQQAATTCHAKQRQEFRNKKHAAQWINTLKTYAFPVIGKKQVSDITVQDCMDVLTPIWSTKTETASRVRQRMETVFSWSITAGYRKATNPATWANNLKNLLPKPSKITKRKHFAALSWLEISAFMGDLSKRKGISCRALEFAILTAARSSEVRFAAWSEIDLKNKIWTIPGARMKAGRAHRVPLSTQAIKLLKALPQNSGYVFPSSTGKALSDGALLQVLKKKKIPAVPHGFRSTFKDWARNCSSAPDEVSELALAHVNSDETRAAYARDELLGPRARLMQSWAQYCYTVKNVKNVTSIRAASRRR